MAGGNGGRDRERRFEHLDGIIGGLLEHATLTDKRMEALREAQQETDASVKGLVAAIRDLSDRIPPGEPAMNAPAQTEKGLLKPAPPRERGSTSRCRKHAKAI
jgi:hypothetical protein